MTIRTFWTIFLKVLGIFLLVSGLTVFTQFISAFSFFGNNPQENLYAILYITALLLLTIAAYVFILWLFVFKPGWIIQKLKLEKGFDEERIDLSVPLKTVLTIAAIVVGGLIFVDALPELCRQIFMSFQNRNVLPDDPSSGWIIFYSVKTLLGYLLMTNSNTVVDFIFKQIREEKNDYPK